MFVPIVIATIPVTCDDGDFGRCDDTMMTDKYVDNDDDARGVFCCQIAMPSLETAGCTQRLRAHMFIKPLVRWYQVSGA